MLMAITRDIHRGAMSRRHDGCFRADRVERSVASEPRGAATPLPAQASCLASRRAVTDSYACWDHTPTPRRGRSLRTHSVSCAGSRPHCTSMMSAGSSGAFSGRPVNCTRKPHASRPPCSSANRSRASQRPSPMPTQLKESRLDIPRGAIIKSPYSRFSFYCGLFSSDATTSIAWRASGSPGRSCRAAAQCSDSRNFISVAVPSEIRNVTFRTCPVRKSATERSFFLERSVFFSGLNLVLLSTFKSWRLPS